MVPLGGAALGVLAFVSVANVATPTAFVAVAAGSLTYLLLLNPITYDQAYVFGFVSASILASLVAALTYFLLTKPVVRSLGKGGYGAVVGKKPANDAEAGPRRPTSTR